MPIRHYGKEITIQKGAETAPDKDSSDIHRIVNTVGPYFEMGAGMVLQSAICHYDTLRKRVPPRLCFAIARGCECSRPYI